MYEPRTLDSLSRDAGSRLNTIPRDITGEIRQFITGRPRHVPRGLRIVDTIGSFACKWLFGVSNILYDNTTLNGEHAATVYDLINRSSYTAIGGDRAFTINNIHYVLGELLPGATKLTVTRLDTGDRSDMPFITSGDYTATGTYIHLSDYSGSLVVSLKRDNTLVLESRNIDIVPCYNPRGLTITGYLGSRLTFSTGETANVGNYTVCGWEWSGNRVKLFVVKEIMSSLPENILLGERPIIYNNIVFLGNGLYLCQTMVNSREVDHSYVYDGVNTYPLPDGLPYLIRAERAMVNGVIQPTLVGVVNDKISMFECVY